LYKKANAIVVNGLVRDAHTIIKENYPIWAKGVSPIGCENIKNIIDLSSDEFTKLKSVYDGNIMVCDDSGVVMIPSINYTDEFIKKLHFIEYQEDILFYCLDTLKMSTFDIVCKKKYLTGTSKNLIEAFRRAPILDPEQLKILSDFSR
jgi:regulator of RNase E activity RraA